MTTVETSTPRTGRRRRLVPSGYEESVQPGPGSRQRFPDPPIYSALVARWSEDGRTVPGRRDPEWSRITGSPIWPNGPLFGN
ncbi:hypothetical protein BGK67_06755 [Streptomyces subrutilus]|uniref:Uncharacterized protein n=1 Tax=Streptomyces subrutilus TaxID=36818 RepID=A0A1E5PNN8_9ACTN|nr:hypothetical protein BGK67_06755 [Streptomyces subrutilus]